MKKFLVTGGSGFIGSNLVKFLLKKNYFVINIDKLSYSANPYNLKRILKNRNYRFFIFLSYPWHKIRNFHNSEISIGGLNDSKKFVDN